MPITPEARRRLATRMEERRLQLGLRWQDVAEAAKVSIKALHDARFGNAGIAPLTQRGIEVGLQWDFGTVQEILNDEQSIGDAIEQEKERARAQVKTALARDPDATPADVFPGEVLAARIWGADLVTEDERLEAIAVLRTEGGRRRPNALRKSS